MTSSSNRPPSGPALRMRNQLEYCAAAGCPPVSGASGSPAVFLSPGEIWRRPLPGMAGHPVTRCMTRLMLLGFRQRFVEVRGLDRVHARHDPFILALNHSQRIEAILIPALLGFVRDGKLIHFLADWNFLLVPGVAMLFRCGQVIPIARKPARPRFLNVFRPLLTDREPGFVRAQRKLEEGASIGIFPEGTTNRDPVRLLKGYSGAAQLSLASGKPVLPAGIRFPGVNPDRPIPETASMIIEIGQPLTPPVVRGEPDLAVVRDWHSQIMSEIARLSGKEWRSQNRRRAHVA